MISHFEEVRIPSRPRLVGVICEGETLAEAKSHVIQQKARIKFNLPDFTVDDIIHQYRLAVKK